MKYCLDWKEYARVSRQAVAEGCVLLKNDNDTLPIGKGSKVSLFGRIMFDYYKSGTGSGGMVNAPYVVSILDALKEEKEISLNEGLLKVYEDWTEANPFNKGKGWAAEPWCQEEMEVSEQLAKEAAAASDMAVVIIGRTAGEDQDNSATEGSYLITAKERQMLEMVCRHFTKVAVVLNVGNIIDMKWVDEYKPSAVLYAWQGGIEGGHGVADVLMGRVNPCGKLTDTIAYNIEDYPSTENFAGETENIYAEDIYVGYRYFETAAKERVMYPFGFGLSYTDFDNSSSCEFGADDTVKVRTTVKNIGKTAGKEIIQVYYNPAQGKLSKPVRNLIRYGKTGVLQPGESEELSFEFPIRDMASFDDSGVTGHANAYVLEAGEYKIYAGSSIREAKEIGALTLADTIVTSQLTEVLAPVKPFDRMVIRVNGEEITRISEPAPQRKVDLKKRIADNRPEGRACSGDKGYKFADVMNERVSLEEYLDQLSDEDLIGMSRGEGMCSSKVTPGIAGSFGGVTTRLHEHFGMPIGGCSDGPSGIRMDCGSEAFAMPNGTSLACSYNLKLVEELYEFAGKEIRFNKIDTLLGPGINIHRNPLNGRNFEYFSEDPYMTGSMAVAMLKGMHKYNVTGTIKHYAANNQEYHRHFVDSVVSQRAMREIYLKAYEMAVKEAGAYSIMTSYGKINGIYTGSNYDLNTVVLRDEWGFDGLVMTDWWARLNDDGESEGSIKNTAMMIRAQNDVYEVTADAESNANGDNAEEALKDGRITRGELLRNARNICRVLMKSQVGKKLIEGEDELSELNRPESNKPKINVMPRVVLDENGEGSFDLTGLKTEAKSDNQFSIGVPGKGEYMMHIKMKSDAGELAQTTMNIFSNNMLIHAITINGTGGEWITRDAQFEVFVSKDVFIDIAFAQSGIEIDSITVTQNEMDEEKKKRFEL